MSRLQTLATAPVRAWRRSLAFRFVSSALVVHAALLTLTGAWLVQQIVGRMEGAGLATQTEAARAVLWQAVTMRIGLFLPLSALVLYLLSVQVVRPLDAARRTAEALASGDLSSRMAVVGPEDTAALARALNDMAEELTGRLEELEALWLVQHQFVSDVAHELRTPLTTVRMAADVIYESRHEFPPVTARSAELLSREVDRFESLLNDLLDLSRMDAGAAVLAAEEVDLAPLVREEAASQGPLAQTYGSEVILDVPESCVARVDAIRVRRILVNLLTNAIEHGEGRPVEVHLRQGPDAVALVVRDHGVGLSETEQGQVFTRFWRADPSRLRTVGGTGLGLPIALENAELHGGSLDVWGRPGEGRSSGCCCRSSPARRSALSRGRASRRTPPCRREPDTARP